MRGTNRLAILVLNSDLALGIRSQGLFLAGMTGLCQQLQNALGIIERCRHEGWRFIAGIAKHYALVACAFIFRGSRIHTLCNVSRLFMKQDFHFGRLPVKTVLLVTNALDGAPRRILNLGVGHRRRPAGFTADNNPVGGRKSFAGDAHQRRVHPLLQGFAVEQIDDLVGNAVANLVRMAFGYGFAGKKIILA
jgi:hypothetical protein